MIHVHYLKERATVLATGECRFEQEIGPVWDSIWVRNSTPSTFVARLALAVRETAYPLLPRMSVHEITGEETTWTTEEILAREG